jgi:mannose-6-phosphate isomerase-like protein (cupin superfamily)
MNKQIREIAQRLHGLRDALDVTTDEMAKAGNVSAADYLAYEGGTQDIPISVLQNIAKNFRVDLSALLFGEDPHVRSFYLTRSGQGAAMERTHAYKYQALASGFMDRKADPFIVTVEPKPGDAPILHNTHAGQEFNYVLEGSLVLSVDGHDLTLEVGDSLFFDASKPHGMKALGGKPVKFLAIIF